MTEITHSDREARVLLERHADKITVAHFEDEDARFKQLEQQAADKGREFAAACAGKSEAHGDLG